MIEAPDVFLADFGVPVTDGTVTGVGILDMPGQIIAGGMVLNTDYQVLVKTSVFGGKMYGDPITVNGINFTVREAQPQDDGLMTMIYLSKV